MKRIMKILAGILPFLLILAIMGLFVPWVNEIESWLISAMILINLIVGIYVILTENWRKEEDE